jgi:phage-related tail protein
MDGMPYWRTVYLWMAQDEELSAHIARAREAGYDAMAEECLLIADNPQYGEKQVMSDQGGSTTVEDMLGHRKLRIETRLKLLAKWNPKKYGDKVQVGGDAENPLKVQTDLTIFDTVLKGIEQSRRG